MHCSCRGWLPFRAGVADIVWLRHVRHSVVGCAHVVVAVLSDIPVVPAETVFAAAACKVGHAGANRSQRSHNGVRSHGVRDGVGTTGLRKRHELRDKGRECQPGNAKHFRKRNAVPAWVDGGRGVLVFVNGKHNGPEHAAEARADDFLEQLRDVVGGVPERAAAQRTQHKRIVAVGFRTLQQHFDFALGALRDVGPQAVVLQRGAVVRSGCHKRQLPWLGQERVPVAVLAANDGGAGGVNNAKLRDGCKLTVGGVTRGWVLSSLAKQ